MSDRMEGFQGQQKQGGGMKHMINNRNVWDVSTGKGFSKST